MDETIWNEGKALIRKLRNRTITVDEMRRLTEIRVMLRKVSQAKQLHHKPF